MEDGEWAAGLMKVKTQRATISTPNEKREGERETTECRHGSRVAGDHFGTD